MTGHMKGSLPFELPVLDETLIVETSSQRVEETEIVISHEDLRQMEDVCKKELPELKSVIRLYKMEEEKAHRERRLKKFPKSLLQWRPEGGQMEPQCEDALTAIREGLQSTAVMHLQHVMETKQHSRDCLYVSKQHPTKRASIVYLASPSSVESKESGKMKFGVIDKIFQHSFASKQFTWVAVNVFEWEQFDSQCGLWWTENCTQQRTLSLLHKVSHPLTTAVENSIIWFLDVP